MSIAAISSALVGPVRSVPPVSSETKPTDRASHRAEAPSSGRRHELVDAMMTVVGAKAGTSGDMPVDAVAPTGDATQGEDHAAEQAVFRFAHALMHDLRQLAGASVANNSAPQGTEGPGQRQEAASADTEVGRSSRRDWSGDLSHRIEGLASKVAVTEDGPPLPNPLTPTSAAVHLMQVPSSRLLQAYSALIEALPGAAPSSTAGDERVQLGAFLHRLAGAITPAGAEVPTVGSLIHETA